MSIAEKLKRLRGPLAALPRAERAVWVRRIDARVRSVAPRLSGARHPHDLLSEALFLDKQAEKERGIDLLPVANFLDSAYRAVSERAAELARDAGKAASGVLSSALLPGLVVVGALYFWSKR